MEDSKLKEQFIDALQKMKASTHKDNALFVDFLVGMVEILFNSNDALVKQNDTLIAMIKEQQAKVGKLQELVNDLQKQTINVITSAKANKRI